MNSKTFKVWASGCAHVNADKKMGRDSLGEAIIDSENYFDWDIGVNIGDFSNWVLNSDNNDSLIDLNYENNLENYYEDLYEINQEVKIEENQYHFLDHPYFGIIVRISSV